MRISDWSSDVCSSDLKLEGSEAFVQRVEADLEMLRASPNGQQMLAEFDKAAANGNIVTIRELQNVDNGYAQSVGGSDIRNGQPEIGRASCRERVCQYV